MIRVIVDDPSVRNHPAAADLLSLYVRLFQLLAGTDSPNTASLTHARAATAEVHGAILRGKPTQDRVVIRQAAFTSACVR